MRLKQTVAAVLAAGILIGGTYGIASADESSPVKAENASLTTVVSALRGENGDLRGENDDLKGLVSDLRGVCYGQADRLYEFADKPDLAVPEELNLMQAKTLAVTWLETCQEITPEDVEAVTNIFAAADTALAQAIAAYQAATKKKNK